MISLEKIRILTPLQNLPKNVRDLGKLIVAKGLKKLPKVQKIAQCGHTVLQPITVLKNGRSEILRRKYLHRIVYHSFRSCYPILAGLMG